jgi:NhaP-type Na+/H+ or K+/H+ antiporter
MNICLAIDYTTCSTGEIFMNLFIGGCLGILLGLLVWWVLDFMEWLETRHS